MAQNVAPTAPRDQHEVNKMRPPTAPRIQDEVKITFYHKSIYRHAHVKRKHLLARNTELDGMNLLRLSSFKSEIQNLLTNERVASRPQQGCAQHHKTWQGFLNSYKVPWAREHCSGVPQLCGCPQGSTKFRSLQRIPHVSFGLLWLWRTAYDFINSKNSKSYARFQKASQGSM